MIGTRENGRQVSPARPPCDRWVDDHGTYLFRFAMTRLHDRAAAEDAVQETLLAALRSYDNFEHVASERTWLTGILKHKVADQYRSAFRTVSFSNLPALDEADSRFFGADGHWAQDREPQAGSCDQILGLEGKEFLRSLGAALSTIPKRLAIVFTLREIEGMETSDICALLSISRENFFVMLHRSRIHLREALAASLPIPR